jgi:hypothetical protein
VTSVGKTLVERRQWQIERSCMYIEVSRVVRCTAQVAFGDINVTGELEPADGPH